ncbi:MAG: thiamine-phosphate kinase, partial [Candidatus Altiarchaeales archaeon]|nr:thiamine-phosphate kinase [Candidatus Altiarchaeales archaeon]
MMCEGDHFRCDWFTPAQVGMKAVESSSSDIAAMGGLPKYCLISISLTDETQVEWVEEMYQAVYATLSRYDIGLVGGDTTHSKNTTIDVTVLGEVEKQNLCLRSHAKKNQLICVTGDLGKSAAGLNLLSTETKGNTDSYLEPKARIREARELAPHASALIDVSDGLASEVNHICRESKVGCLIYAEKVPISDDTRQTAEKLGADPLQWALEGGEDYELVFTIDEEKLREINLDCPITVVGRTTSNPASRQLMHSGGNTPLSGGFNHFG